MSFWYEFPEENRENDIRHPPLTDATVASFEARFQVRFPRRLIVLLREKNGGYLNDKEFKLKGKDYQVDSISGLAEGGTNVIEPISQLEFFEEFPAELGNADRVLVFADFAGHCLYALDYNNCERDQAPRVLYLDTEGEITGREVASSFDEFLDGHYLGDAAPSVHWDEMADQTPALETHVSFQHKFGDEAHLEMLHRVYRRGRMLIIFTRSLWNEKVRLRKAVVELESLAPDFCHISKLDYASGPDVFVVHFHVDPHSKRVDVEDSEQSGNRWKNTRAPLLYDAVHAFDRELLERFRHQQFPSYSASQSRLPRN